MKLMPSILLVFCSYLISSTNAQNLNEPLNVTQLGRWIGGCYLRKVYALEDFAYLIDQADVDTGWAGLRIIDVSNPESPFEVNKIDIEYANDIFVSGKYAYITSEDIYKPPWNGGLWIFDISDPQSPKIENFISLDHGASSVHVLGNYAYIAHDPFGLDIVDITNPQKLSLASTFETYLGPQFVYVSGVHAFITDWGGENWNYSTDNFVRILNISDPFNPFEISRISKDLLGYVRSICSYNNYLFLADGTRKVKIFDIIDPSEPKEIDIIHNYIFGPVRDVFFNKYLYVTDSEYGLSLIEIKQNSATQVGHFKIGNPTWTRSIYAIGNLIYIASGYGDGLYILQNDIIKNDVNNQIFLPTDIELIQNYPNPFNTFTTVRIILKKSAYLTLKIYNINGKEVATLESSHVSAGDHKFRWDPNGQASGLFFYQFIIDDFVDTRKMSLIR